MRVHRPEGGVGLARANCTINRLVLGKPRQCELVRIDLDMRRLVSIVGKGRSKKLS